MTEFNVKLSAQVLQDNYLEAEDIPHTLTILQARELATYLLFSKPDQRVGVLKIPTALKHVIICGYVYDRAIMSGKDTLFLVLMLRNIELVDMGISQDMMSRDIELIKAICEPHMELFYEMIAPFYAAN
jgi:hypothetical protein